VWADGTGGGFGSTTNHQVAIRATNGVWLASEFGGSTNKKYRIGSLYNDNAIIAWGRWRAGAGGGLMASFNVKGVSNAVPGYFTVILNTAPTSEDLVAIVQLNEAMALTLIDTVVTYPMSGRFEIEFRATDISTFSVTNVDLNFSFIVTGR